MSPPHHSWATKKNFLSSSTKITKTLFLLSFYLTKKMSDLHLTLEHSHIKQNYNKELCKNRFKMKYAEFHIHT